MQEVRFYKVWIHSLGEDKINFSVVLNTRPLKKFDLKILYNNMYLSFNYGSQHIVDKNQLYVLFQWLFNTTLFSSLK
jgi:hypothetical protein